MCGIAGFVDYANISQNITILERMTHSLARRGPDASGTFTDGPCGLGHTRLSIIDLAGSPQPMQLPGAAVSLVFNGEIYNYRKLRDQLSANGANLVTNGDTEAILRWVEQEWDQSLPRFDGMFAFGAWHTQNQKLLLARDPIGEKPLFYACPRPGLLVFGSEIKAVLEHPEVNRELDIQSMRQVLRFRAVYGESSLHQGVKQLRPGYFLEFSRSGMRSGRFYDLAERVELVRLEIQSLDHEAIYLRCESLLRESIRERLIADVPVGVFLSGGLDSSLIVAIMRQLRPREQKVRTYSVGFSGDNFSELPFARQVADAIGTDHREVYVTEERYFSRLVELTVCRDAPISEPADIAIAEMSAVAKQDVKVVLSGEGADEVFAGYPKYTMVNASALLRGAARTFGPARIAVLAGCLGIDRRRALVASRALAQPTEIDRIVQWFSCFDRVELQEMLPGLDWTSANWENTLIQQNEAILQYRGGDRLGRMQLVDCMTWLPCNMLERGDRMTMAEGLELRPPFLDAELVPFGLALRSRFKVRNRTTKWLLRECAHKLLPRSIVNRPKWGFRVPLAAWFRGFLRPMLYDYLLAKNGLCGTYGNRRAIKALLEGHDSGRVDANLSLWALLTTEIWFQDVYHARVATPAAVASAG